MVTVIFNINCIPCNRNLNIMPTRILRILILSIRIFNSFISRPSVHVTFFVMCCCSNPHCKMCGIFRNIEPESPTCRILEFYRTTKPNKIVTSPEFSPVYCLVHMVIECKCLFSVMNLTRLFIYNRQVCINVRSGTMVTKSPVFKVCSVSTFLKTKYNL